MASEINRIPTTRRYISHYIESLSLKTSTIKCGTWVLQDFMELLLQTECKDELLAFTKIFIVSKERSFHGFFRAITNTGVSIYTDKGWFWKSKLQLASENLPYDSTVLYLLDNFDQVDLSELVSSIESTEDLEVKYNVSILHIITESRRKVPTFNFRVYKK